MHQPKVGHTKKKKTQSRVLQQQETWLKVQDNLLIFFFCQEYSLTSMLCNNNYNTIDNSGFL